jgi:hypothetical protein
MFRFVLAAFLVASVAPASADILAVGKSSSESVRVIRGAPERCANGPLIIRLHDAGATKSVRCATANPVVASNVTINNTIAIVVDRGHKRRYMRRH